MASANCFHTISYLIIRSKAYPDHALSILLPTSWDIHAFFDSGDLLYNYNTFLYEAYPLYDQQLTKYFFSNSGRNTIFKCIHFVHVTQSFVNILGTFFFPVVNLRHVQPAISYLQLDFFEKTTPLIRLLLNFWFAIYHFLNNKLQISFCSVACKILL